MTPSASRESAHGLAARPVRVLRSSGAFGRALRLVGVGRGTPGLGDAAAVGRRGEVEGSAAGLRIEAQLVSSFGQAGAAASSA